MLLTRYLLGLGLALCLTLPAQAQSQQLHPETGEAILAPETASRSLLRTDAADVARTHGEDLTLVKHLAAGETRGIAVVGDVLFRSNGGYFEALDVSDPAAPEVLSRVLVETSVVQDVQIVGDLAYVVSARSNFPQGAGLRIVDVSDPANMTVVGEALGQTAFGVAVSGDYAYVGASTAGLSVYDVSDPAAPTRVTTLPISGASVLKVAVDGTTAYVSGGNAGFRTIDVSDPENPSVLGTLATSGFATNVAYADGIAYVLVNGAGLIAVDVTDPAMPAQVGQFAIASSQVRGIMLDGDTAFVTSEAGLVVLDISDPTTAITEIGFVAFDNTGSGQSVVRVGDTAYVGNRFDGVRVIDVADLAAPEQIALVQNGGFSFKVRVVGDYAYVSDLIGEYRIIDVSDPENAEIVGRADALPNTSGSAVRDGIAYVVDRTGAPGTGLTRFDVSDPTNPVALDTFTTGSQSFGIDLQGDVAYIANGFFSFISVDVAEPGAFSILDNFNPNSNAFGVRVRDDVAYVANFGGGLVTVDVSDPAAMTQLSTNVVGGFLSSVALDGDLAFLADGQVGLNVVDVSDPAMPQSLGTGPIAGIASGVAYAQGFAYIADEGFGLRQYDVSDPANPVETAAVISADRMTDVDAQGDLVVAVDAGGGVYLFRARDNSPTGVAVVDPAELSVTVGVGDTETTSLTLSNTGEGPFSYAVAVTRPDSVVVDFEDGQNPYGLTLGIPQAETIEATGGNPGRWLHNDVLVTFAPRLYIDDAPGSPFTGDYVARGVRSISIDAQTLAASNTVEGRPFSLRLVRHNGAPNDPEAHDYVYLPGELAPQPGQGWRSYRFAIPSDFEGTLPEGWSGGYYGDPESLPPGVVWQDVLRSVDAVELIWGHPAFFYLLQDFDLGVDNVAITFESEAGNAVTVEPGSGTVAAGAAEELTVTVDAAGLEPGMYEYALTITTDSPATPTLTVPLTVEVQPGVANEEDAVPTVFALDQNYPNPFARATTIKYALPEAAHVTVEVYDAVGRRVAVLVDAEQPVGYHEARWEAGSLASGVYLYRITAGAFTKTLKMSVVR